MHQAPPPDFTKDMAGFPALSGKLQFGKPPVPSFGLTQRQSFGLPPLSKNAPPVSPAASTPSVTPAPSLPPRRHQTSAARRSTRRLRPCSHTSRH